MWRRPQRWLPTLGRREPSHWRDCHFADALSPSLLKRLPKVEGVQCGNLVRVRRHADQILAVRPRQAAVAVVNICGHAGASPAGDLDRVEDVPLEDCQLIRSCVVHAARRWKVSAGTVAGSTHARRLTWCPCRRRQTRKQRTLIGCSARSCGPGSVAGHASRVRPSCRRRRRLCCV